MTKPRRISIRAVRRREPDLKKLSRALIELAAAQAEADAQAQTRSTDQAAQPPENGGAA
jgi:hypothetical protein